MDKRGPYKAQTLQMLKDRGVPVGTVLDVGVLHGTPELIKAFPDTLHVLFEPVEEFYPSIERSYADIPHEIVKAAVSDQSGSVDLEVSSKVKGMDISHSHMAHDFNDAARKVPMVRLDDFVRDRNLEQPYLLKIDIDGHEMRVLRGAEEALRKCSVVIIECTHRTLTERLDWVLRAGFRLFDLSEPCYYDGVFWQCDAIFIRNDFFLSRFTELLRGSVNVELYKPFR